MYELDGFPASKGILFVKNHHDNVVSACSGKAHQVYDRQTEGLDVCQFGRSQGRQSDRRA
jgi:hypothetical protein